MSVWNFKHLGLGALLGLGVFMSIPASQVFAQDIRVIKDDVKQYSLRADKLKESDTTRYNSEMSEISGWLLEVSEAIGKEDAERAQSIAVRLSVYLDYVEASVVRDVEMGKAMEAEAKLKSLKAEYGKLAAQVEQLSAEEEVLKSKSDSMKK